MDRAAVGRQEIGITASSPVMQVAQPTYRVARAATREEMVALREPWDALLRECERASLFETWEWIDTAWRHREADADLWVIAAWDDHGQLAGLAPLMLVRSGLGPFQLRRLTFIGRGVIYPVHLDFLARRSEEMSVARALLDYLAANARRWDLLDLGDLHPDSPLRSCLDDRRYHVRELTGALARLTCLPATWELYQKEHLSSTRRKHLGQYRRKLEREYPGQVQFAQIADAAEVHRALDVFADLNRARWHDRQAESSFDDPAFVAFHHEMAAQALDKGWLRFYVLRVGEEMAAGIYAFFYRDVFYVYQAAFNSNWGKYGPGQLMLGYTAERAIGEGAREWNLMRGEQEYKLSWSEDERVDAHLILSASPIGDLGLLAASLLDRAKVFARERLPENARERLTRLITARGMHKHEPAHASDVPG